MGIGFGELIVVLFILLLIFGPTRLEGIGTSLGRAVRGFKKGMEEGASAPDADKSNKA